MSDRKLAKIVQKLFNQIWKLYRSLSKGLVTWLLRTAMLITRRRRPVAGFVLPTTVFLILVVTLTTGALSYRAYNSSVRTIGNIQSRAVYNAATPAIDRARSKMEALFKDPRYPGGIPSEAFLVSMMLNTGETRPIKGVFASIQPGIADVTKADDPYTLLDEARVDANGDGQVDNAWVYHDNTTNSSVIYSIAFSTPPDDANAGSGGLYGWQRLLKLSDQQKATGDPAAGSYARTGPLSNSDAVTCSAGGGTTVEAGWYADSGGSATLRKRFQVDALVVNDEAGQNTKPANFTTLEFAQDRQLDRGNKWGAWFRNDLEIFPGAPFNWNGAMHTEGSLLIDTGNFEAYLISSRRSCLFLPETNSEISIREVTNQDPTKQFFGVIAAGAINTNKYGSAGEVHIYDLPNAEGYNAGNTLNTTNDWAKEAKLPFGISLDPAIVLTQDGYEAREDNKTNVADRLTEQELKDTNNVFFRGKRFTIEKKQTRPYVDDTYRADDRYGPKSDYNDQVSSPAGQIGNPIPTSDPNYSDLTRTSPPGNDTAGVGLDGYWERRAINNGLRILVGQRLELGNPFGWVPPQDRPNAARQDPDAVPVAGAGGPVDLRRGPDLADYSPANATGANADPFVSDNEGDPLYPPHRFNSSDRIHEERQRRALRDNLAAVQGAAIYHYAVNGGATPVACLATTAHPGTPLTLQQSVNFTPHAFANPTEPWFDFFYGRGTNGWEFTPPTEADLTSGPMLTALQNLAKFAGDPDGAFPPAQGSQIRPDPTLTMWGNFSNLRRALAIDSGAFDYAALSPADKTYLQTAACTLGMLAHNINRAQVFDPSAAANAPRQNTLGALLFQFMDGNTSNGEVLDGRQLATYNYGGDTPPPFSATPTPLTVAQAGRYNPRDYDRVTPGMFLSTLRKYLVDTGVPDPESDERYQLALLIHEQFQIRRDRTFGFRPSPAANTWNYNPFVVELPLAAATNKVTLWSSACDPLNFAVVSSILVGRDGAAELDIRNVDPLGTTQPVETRARLALSRLCGSVIPPASVHDFPGDYNYPARNGIAGAVNAANLPNNGDPSIVPATERAPGYLASYTSGTVNSNAKFADAANPLNTATNPLNNTAAPVTTEESKRALIAPEFPSLYFIFPEFDHSQVGSDTAPVDVDHRQPGNNLGNPLLSVLSAFQPWPEPYITKAVEINTVAASYTALTGAPVFPADTDAAIVYPGVGVPLPAAKLPAGPVTAFSYKALPVFPVADQSVNLGVVAPRAALASWTLPNIPTATVPNTADDAPPNLIRTATGVAAVPFLDRVLFNGREWLPTRVVDIDLDMLRRSAVTGAPGEAWLPVSGIVYAFREDAIREDAIARPAGGAVLAGPPSVTQTDARDPLNATDPPVAAGEISTKPVDFIADPDRRPHGFRLRNGAQLSRLAAGIPAEDNIRGLSFFSDSPTYIMGDFNKHQTAAGQPLEEFTQQILSLNANYTADQFYRQRRDRDPAFAKADQDLWRPSEVLADTVTIISKTFCDGSAIDTFMAAGPNAVIGDHFYPIGSTTATGNTTENRKVYQQLGGIGAAVYNTQTRALFAPGCVNNGATSFLNQNRPNLATPGTGWDWIRENPGDVFSPVKISRNGDALSIAPHPATPNNKPRMPVEYGGRYNGNLPPALPTVAGDYHRIDINDGRDDERPVQTAAETTVNTIMISGIVPSRENQGYGGLHNFPRFLEWWEDVNLKFLGAFLQLNFSNYATAPYDEDVWEPGLASNGKEIIDYYGFAPNRRWGYDVALQLAPAGPAAARFVTPGSNRNEFYIEPAANDLYMQNLCRSLKANAGNAPNGVPLTNLNCPT